MSGPNHAYFLVTPYLKVLTSVLIPSLPNFFLLVMFSLMSPLFHILIYYNHSLNQTLPLYQHGYLLLFLSYYFYRGTCLYASPIQATCNSTFYSTPCQQLHYNSQQQPSYHVTHTTFLCTTRLTIPSKHSPSPCSTYCTFSFHDHQIKEQYSQTYQQTHLSYTFSLN